MTRPHIMQFGITILIILVIYFTYDYLNNSENSSKNFKKTEVSELIEKKINKSNKELDKNIISELTYKSQDNNGNIYEINSASGIIQENEKNTLLLKKVEAKIIIHDYGIVYIFADNAYYNKLNLDTHFYENVNLIFENHDIKSDDLFLEYSEKKVKISNNVYYEGKNSELMADEVVMNLLTKVSKIYMTNEKKKVKAIINN